MRVSKSIIIFVSYLLLSQTAVAITVPEIANTISNVNPGLTQKRLSQDVPQARSAPVSPIKLPAQAPTKPQTAEEKIHLKLKCVIIKGNTVFSQEKLQEIFKPSYGKTISLATLQKKVNEITVKYRDAGYILSHAFLPEQVIKDGKVTVQVIEGFVEQVKIEGHPGWVEKMIKRYGKNITDSRPLQMKTLERSVLLINDLPGVSSKAVINPSRTTPAAADLVLVTQQQRVNAYISYDNYGTRYLGPQEIGAGLTLNSVTFPGSSDGIYLMTVPKTSELQFIQYSHAQPVGAQGGKLSISGSYTNTAPQFVLQPLEIVGRTQTLYADYFYPIIRSRDKNLFVHFAASYENVSSTILGGPFYSDLIRSLILGGGFSASDRWRGVNDIKIDFEKGLYILGAKKHILQSRLFGNPSFLKINATASRLQALPWNLSFFVSLQGQYAFQPLLTAEQYGFGGSNYGRGYDPSEIVGDEGFAAKFELRKDKNFDKLFLNNAQCYIFYDSGIVWNRDQLTLLPKQSATSIGGGVRLNSFNHISANFYYAKPLTHSLGVQVVMNKDPLVPRMFFQLVASY